MNCLFCVNSRLKRLRPDVRRSNWRPFHRLLGPARRADLREVTVTESDGRLPPTRHCQLRQKVLPQWQGAWVVNMETREMTNHSSVTIHENNVVDPLYWFADGGWIDGTSSSTLLKVGSDKVWTFRSLNVKLLTFYSLPVPHLSVTYGE